MKIAPCLFLLATVWLISPVTAQDFEYPKGVYMTWEEVKLKTPSQHYNVIVQERSGTDIATTGGNKYKVVSLDSLSKKIIKQKIWAVSDGKDLYLNGYLFNIQSSYMKAEHIGARVILVQGVARNEDVAGVGGGLVPAIITGSKHPIYRIGKTSGRTQKLDKKIIETELEQDPELLKLFQEENRGNAETILKYAIIINSKHN